MLVAGLLLIGEVAAADGLFEAVGAWLAGSRLGSRQLLVALLALVAIVTAVLNLDTAVVFLTPVLVHVARRRTLDERPFLYGSVFMANSGSLLLPGSNLTNLLVLRASPAGAAAFATHMLGPWIAACGLTTIFLAFAFPLGPGTREADDAPALRVGVGAGAIFIAAGAMLLIRNAALPVVGIGLGAALCRRLFPRFDPRMLVLLWAFTTALGACARSWTYPARLVAANGAWATAWIAAASSVVLNNLPAAVFYSAREAHHRGALLLGFDLGPNLAVTGSLSAVLWLSAARAIDSRPSIATYSRLGALLVPLTLAGALAARSV